jgi:membrane-associated protease RseP (regulator of RpoE activity)
LITVTSTLVVGAVHGMSFWAPELLSETAPPATALEWLRRILVYGAPFSFTLLAIIFCHEMGHFWTARHYRVDTTLPFFLPFPSLIGTLGAFILIKSRFPHRKALIDIGLAGPFAGFAVVIPALVLGIATSRPMLHLPSEGTTSFGEPLLFQWVYHWVWPDLPQNYDMLISPIGLAAWFGLLLTALNLFPIGQLDGGHATYALFKSGAYRISAVAFFAFLPMAYFGPSWLFWAGLLYVLGIRRPHPPTYLDSLPLPASRRVMGLAALVVLILCFTPEPIVFSWTDAWTAFREWMANGG